MARGSRHLNTSGSALGLNTWDLMGALAVLVVSSEGLKPLGFESLSVPLAILSLIALIPIRLRQRRRIIRDSLAYGLGMRGIQTPQKSQRGARC